jgi:hypothetical protein
MIIPTNMLAYLQQQKDGKTIEILSADARMNQI